MHLDQVFRAMGEYAEGTEQHIARLRRDLTDEQRAHEETRAELRQAKDRTRRRDATYTDMANAVAQMLVMGIEVGGLRLVGITLTTDEEAALCKALVKKFEETENIPF